MSLAKLHVFVSHPFWSIFPERQLFVRVGRIELPSSAWKADILPLNHTRYTLSELRDGYCLSGCRDSNPESPVPKTGMLAVTPHPDIFY